MVWMEWRSWRTDSLPERGVVNMEINLNPGLSEVPSTPPPRRATESVSLGRDASEFAQAATLEKALAATPDVRADVVDQAKQLVAQSAYPPPETIQRIASLLAANVIQDSQESSVDNA